MIADKDFLSAVLKAEGLDFVLQDEGLPTWRVTFSQEDGPKGDAFLTIINRYEYILIFSFVPSKKLYGRPIEDLDAPTLRAMILAASDSPLAKLEYRMLSENSPAWLTTSECSREDVNGRKLRARLEACVRIASEVARQVG